MTTRRPCDPRRGGLASPPLDLTEPTLDVGIVAHDSAGCGGSTARCSASSSPPAIPVAGGEVVVHRLGSSTVKLWCLESPPEAGEGGIDAAIGYCLLTLIVPDLDGVLARAEAAATTGVERRAFGKGNDAVRLAFLGDADGNALELVGIPGAEPSLQVGLTVGAVDRTREFFTGSLDLTANPVTSFDDIVSHSVGFGSTVVKFWHRGDGLPVHTGPISERAGIRYVTAHVASVHSAVETQAVVAFVADPDGNFWELIER